MNLSTNTKCFDLGHEFIGNGQSLRQEDTFLFCPNVMPLISILTSLQIQFAIFIWVWLVHREYLRTFI